MKKHVYFVPGMFASSLIFERIHLPKDQFETHLLEWMMPMSTRESLDSYVDRFSKLIVHEAPILVGVSFGGIIVQELVKKFPEAKVVLISSLQHQTELKPFFKFAKKTNLYLLYPSSLVNGLEKIIYKVSSKKIKRTLEIYRKFVPIRNSLYTQWAIHHFLNWKQSDNQEVIRIHGDKDQMIPIKYIGNSEVIPNGSHAMIITKSTSVQQWLLTKLV